LDDINKNKLDSDVDPSLYIDPLGLPDVYMDIVWEPLLSAPHQTNQTEKTNQTDQAKQAGRIVKTHRLDEVKKRPKILSVRVGPILIGNCVRCGKGCESRGEPILCGCQNMQLITSESARISRLRKAEDEAISSGCLIESNLEDEVNGVIGIGRIVSREVAWWNNAAKKRSEMNRELEEMKIFDEMELKNLGDEGGKP